MKAALLVQTALLAVAVSGCVSLQGDRSGPGGPATAPTYAELARLQNERFALISRLPLYLHGPARLSWTEGERQREYQGRGEIWFQPPFRTAVVLSEEGFGEKLLWLGSDENRYWLFDLTGDERVLYTAPHDVRPRMLDQRFGSLRPLTMLDLMGLLELPPLDPPPAVEWDEQAGGWSIRVPGRFDPLRIVFSPQTKLPVRIEALDETGRPLVVSTLRDYRFVDLEGAAVMQRPQLPEVVEIENEDDPGRATYRMFLRSASFRIEDQPPDQAFDLERLIRSLRPVRIEGGLPGEQQPAP